MNINITSKRTHTHIYAHRVCAHTQTHPSDESVVRHTHRRTHMGIQTNTQYCSTSSSYVWIHPLSIIIITFKIQINTLTHRRTTTDMLYTLGELIHLSQEIACVSLVRSPTSRCVSIVTLAGFQVDSRPPNGNRETAAQS